VLALAAERAPVFVACEPRRARIALQASKMLWVLGANDVTRHDAVVSVRAGFTGNELSAAWPAGSWKLEERVALPFTHFFCAREG
jgi:pyrroline-5-carboxylate reductase